MTNKQWLATLDTESLAKLIADICSYCTGCYECAANCCDGIMEWLETKHKEEQ